MKKYPGPILKTMKVKLMLASRPHETNHLFNKKVDSSIMLYSGGNSELK